MSKICVVIPSYNSGDLLLRCLESLRRSEEACGTPIHEIVVVDDASTDDSACHCGRFGARLCALTTNVGPARARNAGAELATGDILWFVDADVEVATNSVGLVSRYFDNHPDRVAAIGSYDASPSEPNLCSQFKNLFHHFVHQSAGDTVSSFWSGCGCIRTEIFREVGGFDEAYWNEPSVEDIHLGYLLGRTGHSIHMIRELQVKHHKRWTLVNLVRTDVFLRAVPWTAMLLHNRGRGGSELNLGWQARASVVSVYLSLLVFPFAMFSPLALIVAVVLAMLPAAMNMRLIAFFSRRRGWHFAVRAYPLLLFYFFYCGVGFVLGVVLYMREARSGRHVFAPRSDEPSS